MPATCGKRPPASSIWLTPFSSASITAARHPEGRERVLERQHRQHLAHGDLALVDRGAQAAAIGDRDLDALILHAVEHRVGDEVAHLAFARAADLARAVDRRRGLGDDLVADLFQRFGQLGDAGLRLLVLSTEASRRIGAPPASVTLPSSSKVRLIFAQDTCRRHRRARSAVSPTIGRIGALRALHVAEQRVGCGRR